MAEEISNWICCSCNSPNFDTDACVICGHSICDKCKKLTEEETKQIIEGKEKASTWLIGQERNKRVFSREAYEKNLNETQLQELQEQMESQMEEGEERKDVARKKR